MSHINFFNPFLPMCPLECEQHSLTQQKIHCPIIGNNFQSQFNAHQAFLYEYLHIANPKQKDWL